MPTEAPRSTANCWASTRPSKSTTTPSTPVCSPVTASCSVSAITRTTPRTGSRSSDQEWITSPSASPTAPPWKALNASSQRWARSTHPLARHPSGPSSCSATPTESKENSSSPPSDGRCPSRRPPDRAFEMRSSGNPPCQARIGAPRQAPDGTTTSRRTCLSSGRSHRRGPTWAPPPPGEAPPCINHMRRVVSEVPGDAERLDALEHLAGCPVDDADPGVDLIGAPVLVERVPGDGELDGGFAAVPGGGVRAGKEVVGERVLAPQADLGSRRRRVVVLRRPAIHGDEVRLGRWQVVAVGDA